MGDYIMAYAVLHTARKRNVFGDPLAKRNRRKDSKIKTGLAGSSDVVWNVLKQGVALSYPITADMSNAFPQENFAPRQKTA